MAFITAANTINVYLCPSDPTTEPPPTWTNGWVVGSYAINNEVFGDRNNPGYTNNLVAASLTKGFGLSTVAECVENAEDAALLCAEGVGYLQGYHLGPPTIERAWLGDGGARQTCEA